MFTEVLNGRQQNMLEILKQYKRRFYLAGGTAIALQLGHRSSLDFDLFTHKNFSHQAILSNLTTKNISFHVIHEEADQLHIIANGVKLTFLNFPYSIPHIVKLRDYFSMPDLPTLAAMKALALGGRAKWKDYTDLYFLINHGISMAVIVETAGNLFGNKFNAKLFKQQLAYFEDIDYSEEVEYIGKTRPSKATIQKFLTSQALLEF